ncbi:GNAT family N-acetyltransferase [Pedobacter sp. PAMC26386]|nr:GNAT family N-acetyltransferase [Pedobacter sp. PAMC26386]
MKLDFSIFPELETARLKLRKMVLTDAPAVLELRSDPEVAKLTGREVSRNIDDAIAHINKIEGLIGGGKSLYWAISNKEEDALIGTICFWNFDVKDNSIEIGYEVLPAFHRKGIASEAIVALISFGFQNMMVTTITAFPSIDNAASVSLLEKLGFKLASDTYLNTHENEEGMLTYILSK